MCLRPILERQTDSERTRIKTCPKVAKPVLTTTNQAISQARSDNQDKGACIPMTR